ncbi:MAG: hypothetical protein LBG19_07140 [Prevotellaceae bacterium]|jgi:uncharacterized protein YndB with AHSA1/START domain|nr:hypothetical protein [Prevotellaceae bacterium]
MIDGKLNGTVRQLDNDHFVLTFSRKLHIAIEEAWDAIAKENERREWFQGVSFVDRADGIIRLAFGDEGMATGNILSINKPTELAHTLVWEDMPTSEVS